MTEREIRTVDQLTERECHDLLKQIQYFVRRSEMCVGSLTDTLDNIASSLADFSLDTSDMYECYSCDAELTRGERDKGALCARCAHPSDEESES